jgi:threonylcarbamoyladenosine tRNA methylthiotransferase MtaB
MYPAAIFTLGCKLNQLESEAIAGSFAKAGFTLVPWGGARAPAIKGPGIFIVNTCTVTSKADQKARRIIRKALRDNPEVCVIVTGCYAQLDRHEIESLDAGPGGNGCGSRATGGPLRRLFVQGGGGQGAGAAKSVLLDLPVYLRDKIDNFPLPQLLEHWFSREREGRPFDFKPENFAFHSRGYLKIQDGCGNGCTYCRTSLARGPSCSLPKEDALERLLAFEGGGCAELMITGVNVSRYNHSGADLAGLLEYLLAGSKTIALRLSSLEPECIGEKLASVIAHPRIRPHFHLSVQSGSEAVLKRMGRSYGPAKIGEGAALLRSAKDNPFLACDIIAGFPGETEDDFLQTLALCEKINCAWIHAFPYSRRRGTAAYSFGEGPGGPAGPSVCERETTRRVEALMRLAVKGRREYVRQWLGREISAVAEKGKTDGSGQCRAVSENYLKLLVNFSGEPPQPGTSIRCIPIALCEAANGETPDAVADAAADFL